MAEKYLKMSIKISATEAYKTYSDLKLRKDGIKSANLQNISRILDKYCVQITEKPTDTVTFIRKCRI